MLDKLIKVSSISSALLIFCGVLKLIIFYNGFQINIIDFLSFTEIITSFLDDVNLILIYMLAMIVQSVPLMNFLHRKSGLSFEEFFNHLLWIVYARRKGYIIFFMVALAIPITLIALHVFSLSYFLIYFIVFCLIQLLTFLLMYPSEGKIEISNLGLFVSLAITIAATVILLAHHDIEVTTRNLNSVTLETNSHEIICNRETGNIYLGKTDGFVFIRMNDQTSICLPIESIQKFTFAKQEED